MADKTEFLQAIDDAILDADSLERFINGSDSEAVLTRLSAEYPTLQKAIKELFENGGLPATPFKTKTEMEASELTNGAYGMVTDDTPNNGLYQKTDDTWVRSKYDPLAVTLKKLSELRDDIYGESESIVYGQIAFSHAGALKADGSASAGYSTWRYTSKIPVRKGQLVEVTTLVAIGNEPWIVFYNKSGEFVESELTTGVVREHVTRSYNVKQDGYIASQHTSTGISGCSITIHPSSINFVTTDKLSSIVLPRESIDGFVPRTNLFDKTKVISDKYVYHIDGRIVPNSSFPSVQATGYMAVKPSTQYTTNFNGVSSWLAEYDKDKVFIKGYAGNNQSTITTTGDTAYIVANLNTGSISLDDYAFVEGDSVPEQLVGYDSLEWLESRLTKLREDIEDYVGSNTSSGALDRFKGKNLLVSGDSITETNYHTAKSWHGFLKDWLGFGVVQNEAVSGSGLVKTGSGVGSNYRLAEWSTKYDKPDYILIMGNMNDGTSDAPGAWDWIYGGEGDPHKGDWTTLVTSNNMADSLWFAWRYQIEQILSLYPNAPIGIITSTPRGQLAAKSGAPRQGYDRKCWGQDGWFSEWADVITEVANHYSIPVLDLYHQSNFRPWIAENNAEFFSNNDKIHPNIKGHEAMAQKILEFTKQYL